MRKTILLAILLTLVLPLLAVAADDAANKERRFGLGVIVGEPTGISAKYFLDRKQAIDFGVAWSLSGDNEFTILADYLYHNYDLIEVQKGALPVYFGVGGRWEFRENKDDKIGVRFPIGVSYLFADVPVETFAEVVPILDLYKDTELDLSAAIGARFYF